MPTSADDGAAMSEVAVMRALRVAGQESVERQRLLRRADELGVQLEPIEPSLPLRAYLGDAAQ